MLTIVPYEEAHFDAFIHLLSHWGPEWSAAHPDVKHSIDAVLRTEDHVDLAFNDRGLVGYVQYGPRYRIGYEPFFEIIQLLVSEDQRSSGIGAALVRHVEDAAREAGMQAVRLDSQVHRSRAHVFYERQGYSYYKISKFYAKNLTQE